MCLLCDSVLVCCRYFLTSSVFCVFFFKQKTAYEMRISDWSSDVCSSDLDGRFGNNPWAQELPKPVTTLTWDNAVLISPALAARHDLENGDEVRLVGGTGSLTGPVWVMPGQASETILVHRGYGRRFGEVASGAGFDIAPLLGWGTVTLEPDRKSTRLKSS